MRQVEGIFFFFCFEEPIRHICENLLRVIFEAPHSPRLQFSNNLAPQQSISSLWALRASRVPLQKVMY
jgi:cell division inhibitor SulA